MSLFGRFIMCLVPDRHMNAAREAEADAVESRLAVRDAYMTGHRVENLGARMTQDRERNHYGDRFAQAFGLDQA